jgi:hypothetical protein
VVATADQKIASQDPEGWRVIMVAVAADGTHLPNLRIARENKPIEIGAVIASENQGKINIGLCTAVEGCYMLYEYAGTRGGE